MTSVEETLFMMFTKVWVIILRRCINIAPKKKLHVLKNNKPFLMVHDRYCVDEYIKRCTKCQRHLAMPNNVKPELRSENFCLFECDEATWCRSFPPN